MRFRTLKTLGIAGAAAVVAACGTGESGLLPEGEIVLPESNIYAGGSYSGTLSPDQVQPTDIDCAGGGSFEMLVTEDGRAYGLDLNGCLWISDSLNVGNVVLLPSDDPQDLFAELTASFAVYDITQNNTYPQGSKFGDAATIGGGQAADGFCAADLSNGSIAGDPTTHIKVTAVISDDAPVDVQSEEICGQASLDGNTLNIDATADLSFFDDGASLNDIADYWILNSGIAENQRYFLEIYSNGDILGNRLDLATFANCSLTGSVSINNPNINIYDITFVESCTPSFPANAPTVVETFNGIGTIDSGSLLIYGTLEGEGIYLPMIVEDQ